VGWQRRGQGGRDQDRWGMTECFPPITLLEEEKIKGCQKNFYEGIGNLRASQEGSVHKGLDPDAHKVHGEEKVNRGKGFQRLRLPPEERGLRSIRKVWYVK